MKRRMDKSSVAGLTLGIAAIAGGVLLEGGKIGQIVQPTAALIVLGGTFGAVMLSFPLRTVLAAVKQVATLFSHGSLEGSTMIETLTGFCHKARREGVLSLDAQIPGIEDPFLRRAMTLAVDGTDPRELQKLMELENELQAEREEEIPRVFDAAGGYSPTIGIIGAVLGLIQVMQHLDNIEEVGKGIAVAFVATIYGVSFANLFCLPAGAKLKVRANEARMLREMVLQGVVSMLEGINPRVLEMKLSAYLDEPAKPEKKGAAYEPEAAEDRSS